MSDRLCPRCEKDERYPGRKFCLLCSVGTGEHDAIRQRENETMSERELKRIDTDGGEVVVTALYRHDRVGLSVWQNGIGGDAVTLTRSEVIALRDALTEWIGDGICDYCERGNHRYHGTDAQCGAPVSTGCACQHEYARAHPEEIPYMPVELEGTE